MRLQGGPLHVGWRCREHLVMYACNPPEGAVDHAVDVQRLPIVTRVVSILFYPHSYLFDGAAAAVTSSRRLPVWGGQ